MKKVERKNCISCGKENISKDEIGICKKLLGDTLTDFYCLDCLADYLGCSTEDILDKIEEFKEEGCILFS